MSQQTITLEDQHYANIAEYHKLFKMSPQSITQEQRTYLGKVNDALWVIAGNKQKPIDDRIKHYGLIKLVHEILGRKFDDNWIPKVGSGAKQFTKRIISVEERQANCDAFVKYLASRNLEDPTVTVDALAKVWSGSY